MSTKDRADALLQSAREILLSPCNTFTMVTPMPKAVASETAKALKAAAKKASTKPYKHESARRRALEAEDTTGSRVDTPTTPVVESSFPSPQPKDTTVTTEAPVKTKQELDAEKAQAKIAAKEAKAAERQAAIAEKQRLAEEKKAEKLRLAEEKKAAREAAKAEKAPREKTYTGTMLTLADRVKAGHYVKGANGQLRSNDDVALVMETIPAKSTVKFLLKVLKLEVNPYESLNYGQQSMNLRNKLRGAIKAGQKEGAEDPITIEGLKKMAAEWVAEASE